MTDVTFSVNEINVPVTLTTPQNVDVDLVINEIEVPVTLTPPTEISITLSTGVQGPIGPTGPGVVEGGTTGQVLRKTSNVSYECDWSTLTKTDIGLGNCDNTADINKSISAATQAALDLKTNDSSLATVAKSGSYTDLSNKPSIPTSHTQLSDIGTNTHAQIDSTLSTHTSDISTIRKIAYNSSSTTLLTGGEITINPGDLTVNIAAGTGVIVDNHTDPLNPTRTVVTWGTITNHTPAFLTTGSATFFYIDINGDLQESEDVVPFDQIQDYVVLGWVEHYGQTIVEYHLDEPYPAVDLATQMHQFFEYFGAWNYYGNEYSGNANLTVKRSAGAVFDGGTGWLQNKQDVNLFRTNQIPTVSLRYYNYDAGGNWVENNSITTLVDPEYYNTPTGLAAVPAGKWTLQRLYLYAPTENNDFIYGDQYYDSLDDAVADRNAAFEVPESLPYDVLRGWLAVQQGCTDLSDPTKAYFFSAGRFGSIASAQIGGSGGGEINTASNIGTLGVGVFKNKLGVDLRFKNIASANDCLSVAEDANNNIVLTSVQSFETVSKNLKGKPYTLSYTGSTLNSITYNLGGGQSIVKTLNYTGSKVTSIVLSGDTPSGISLTKTFSYTGDLLTSVSYS